MNKCCCRNQCQYITKTILSISAIQISAEMFLERRNVSKINTTQNWITKNKFHLFLQKLIWEYHRKKVDSLSPKPISAEIFLRRNSMFLRNTAQIFIRRTHFEMKKCFSSKKFQFIKKGKIYCICLGFGVFC